MKTPLLLMAFNRPEPTRKVFSEIRKARPERLFVAVDGPRDGRPEDLANTNAVREIVSTVDWPCEVKTLFRDKNLGCKIAVSSAIDWFFDHVEQGIILEDDCLPDPSFFPFCEELLAKYKDDEKVMMVSGFNTRGSWPDTDDSYLFSKYVAIWGWASWRRAWKYYDVGVRSWSDDKVRESIKKRIANPQIWKSKQWTYDQLYAGTKDTWDYQWEYALLSHSGLSIIPTRNMIKNIGVGQQATHTTNEKGRAMPDSMPTIFPLTHPVATEANVDYDDYFTRQYQGQPFMAKVMAQIKSWLK